MTTDTWARLAASVRRHEGLRLTPYTDTTGHLSIGYGRNLSSRGITVQEAELLLHRDLADAEQALLTAHPWATRLTPPRYAVLVELAFNLGLPRLSIFVPTLALIEAGDYARAGGRLKRSKWAAQVGGRADRLIAQLVTGEWASA